MAIYTAKQVLLKINMLAFCENTPVNHWPARVTQVKLNQLGYRTIALYSATGVPLPWSFSIC
jgi:hypothetical protein